MDYALADIYYKDDRGKQPYRELANRRRLEVFRASGGPLAPFRLVRLVSGNLTLAGSTDVDIIGASSQYQQSNVFNFVSVKPGLDYHSRPGLVVQAADAFDAEDEVYLAADGKVSASGSVRFGVSLNRSDGADKLVRILPD